ncbi:MAG: hypothetical protein IT370_17120 [Deltaproteobacteria bacterium]|nr:hypothetical protein [Deltaproteobacteria bacterium]
MGRLAIASMLVLLCCAGVARADDAAAKATEARRLYDEGQKLYNLGEFPRAIEQFKQAYQLSARPGLLFNIAQAHRLNGNFKQALFFYESFLRGQPDAKNRAEVDRRILEMREAVARADAQQPPAPSPTPSPTPSPSASPEPSPLPSPSPVTSPVPLPGPDDVAAHSQDGQLGAPAGTVPAPRDSSKPIYKRWWFWAGLGAVAVGAAATIILVGSGDGGGAPDTDFRIVEAY